MSSQEFISEVGRLTLIMGPMFSGKTTELLHELITLSDVGLSVLYINHSDDVRETVSGCKGVSTHHSGFSNTSDNMSSIQVKYLRNVDVDDYDVIGIDEGQFFDHEVKKGVSELEYYVRKWMLIKHKLIYVAGLNGDYRIKNFGPIRELICLASEVKMKSAKCMKCMKQTSPYRRYNMVDAPFTGKIKGKKGSVKDVGGSDKYMALCLKCHLEI